MGLDSATMHELLDPLPATRRVIPSISVTSKVVNLWCERQYRCEGGKWVKKDLLRKNESESPGETKRFGGRPISTIANIVDLVDAAKPLVAELDAALNRAKAFGCD
jgi:hypothetical protein